MTFKAEKVHDFHTVSLWVMGRKSMACLTVFIILPRTGVDLTYMFKLCYIRMNYIA